MNTFKIHPAADCFPMITGEAEKAFKHSIETQGQLEPIKVMGDVLLDGRNRLRACEELGIDVEYTEVETDDVVAFVIASNDIRRHLTTPQRAAVAAELANMTVGKPKKDIGQNCPISLSLEEAAEKMHVSRRSVVTAKQRMQEDPEAHKTIKEGGTVRKAPKTQSVWTGLAARVEQPKKVKAKDWTHWLRSHKKQLSAHAGVDIGKNLTPKELNVLARKTEAWLIADIDPAYGEQLSAGADIVEEVLTEKQKFDRAVKKRMQLIDVEVDLMFREKAREYMEHMNGLLTELEDFKESVKSPLTGTEYKALLAFVHPDRHPDNEKKAANAFRILQEKAELLTDGKKVMGDMKNVPQTVEELLARRG